MRDFLILHVNSRPLRVSAADAFLSLSDFLRLRLGLVGTKIVCSEGDCGSCTVLIGRPAGDHFRYLPIDSCIQRMFQLDLAHVVTVEGLGHNGQLTPVEEAMIECHGSQCGFCTPGFVVAMTGMLEENARPANSEWRRGLTGNLCRCTGYVPILDAGAAVDPDVVQRMSELYPPAEMLARVQAGADQAVHIAATDQGRTRQVFIPTTLAETLDVVARHTDAKIVAGATDVGVQLNKGTIDPSVFLDVNRVDELAGAAIETADGRRTLVAGARATWTEIEALCETALPEFHQIVSVFGSPQIRHAGTLGGNIINASPIADSLPLLYVMDAVLELHSATGGRQVPINEFYHGYKQFDLRPGELLVRIRMPMPTERQTLRLMKVSRRRDLDISTFTAAILLEIDEGTIHDARVALGAVGPTVLRARRTEEFLRGSDFNEDTMRAAGDVTAGEVTPIDDVRGSAEYRYQLTRNAFLKFYHEQTLAPVG